MPVEAGQKQAAPAFGIGAVWQSALFEQLRHKIHIAAGTGLCDSRRVTLCKWSQLLLWPHDTVGENLVHDLDLCARQRLVGVRMQLKVAGEGMQGVIGPL